MRTDPLTANYPIRIRYVTIGVLIGISGIFYIFAFIAMFYMAYNLLRLFTVQVGKPDGRSFNFIGQLYNSLSFGIGQKKVYSKRFTYASIMHFLIGWGFIELTFATTVDFFTARGWFINYLPEFDTPWFAFINDTGGLMLIVGCFMALFRRHYIKPEILPQNNLLPYKKLKDQRLHLCLMARLLFE